MRTTISKKIIVLVGLVCMCLALPVDVPAKDRLRIEVYGGMSFLNPKDLNMLSKAEEEYTDVYFIQRQLYKQGYFVNEFPRIFSAFPAGLRLKYRFAKKLFFSIGVEGFYQKVKDSLEGTMSYSGTDWFDNQTKTYDPFQIGLSGYSALAGLHLSFPIKGSTELEIGGAAGWTWGQFDFTNTWAHTIHFWIEDYWEFRSQDGGTLTGDGSGNGFTARVMLRLNRSLGKRLGFFVEASGTTCRLKSLFGGGSETRLGIPGEATWEGTWGIKKEDLDFEGQSKSIKVPSNYWEGWPADQRDRDFSLNLSRVQFVIGFYIRL